MSDIHKLLKPSVNLGPKITKVRSHIRKEPLIHMFFLQKEKQTQCIATKVELAGKYADKLPVIVNSLKLNTIYFVPETSVC